MSDQEPPTGVWNPSTLVPGGAANPANPTPPPPADPWQPPPAAMPPPATTPSPATMPPPGPMPPPVANAAPWQPPPPPPPPQGHRRVVIAAVATAVLVLAAGGTVVALRLAGPESPPATVSTGGQATEGRAGNAEPTVPAATDTGPALENTTDPTTADPEEAALAELEQIHQQDLATISLNGQLAAQIASKYPGIVDPLQTTQSGSHTFRAIDILAEHKRLRDEHDSAAHPIVLLKSTDYGKRQLVDNHFLWVTFAVGDFPDRGAVKAWCNAQFADLSTTERENQCAVRHLEP